MLDAAGNPKFDVLLGDGRPVALAQQTMKLLLGRSPHTIPALGLAALERLSGLTARQFAAFREQGVALRRALDAEIGDGVMLYPPFWRTAPRHDRALLRPLRFGYTAILNVMELPATQVPCGLSARGLPTGVQVVAGHGGDHKTIAVARVLEQALGGWIPPRGLGSAIGS
jgi:fatty acid amide hydrolase 2